MGNEGLRRDWGVTEMKLATLYRMVMMISDVMTVCLEDDHIGDKSFWEQISPAANLTSFLLYDLR